MKHATIFLIMLFTCKLYAQDTSITRSGLFIGSVGGFVQSTSGIEEGQTGNLHLLFGHQGAHTTVYAGAGYGFSPKTTLFSMVFGGNYRANKNCIEGSYSYGTRSQGLGSTAVTLITFGGFVSIHKVHTQTFQAGYWRQIGSSIFSWGLQFKYLRGERYDEESG